MKKLHFYILTIFVTLLLGFENVSAKDLSCDYHYYYNGNGLNQGSTAYDLWATCIFEFKDSGDLSSHSCTMNYYYKSEDNEKTKKVKLDNWTATGNYKFVYSNDGKSVKESINNTKQCPSYLVAYYNVKSTLWWDSSSFQLYAAIDESRAHEMVQHWADAGAIANTHILNGTFLPTDVEEQEKAYKKIQEWTTALEKSTETSFDFSECEDSTKVITRYSECKTLISNMETTISTIEKEFNGYVKNNIVDENDSRVKKLYELIEKYKNEIKKVNNNMENLDCETKLQLGLVNECGVVQPEDDLDDSDGETHDPEYNSSSKTCVSCGDEALTNIPEQLPMFVRNIVLVLQLLVPILLIGMGMYDFIRAVTSNDEKMMKESQNKFIKRIIAGVLIFLVTAIVKFAFSLIPNSADVISCIPCFISSSNSCSAPYTCSMQNFESNIGDVTSGKDSNSGSSNSSSTGSSSSSSSNGGNGSSNGSSSSKKSCTDYNASDCPSKAENGNTCKVTYDSWDTKREHGYCATVNQKSCSDYSVSDCPSKAENGKTCKVTYDNWDTKREHGYCATKIS